LPIRTPNSPLTWKPSYGVYFTTRTTAFSSATNKKFVYFTDLNQNSSLDDCNPTGLDGNEGGGSGEESLEVGKSVGGGGGGGSAVSGECLEIIALPANTTVTSLDIGYTIATLEDVDNLSITFARPSSSAVFSVSGVVQQGVAYARIGVRSSADNSTNFIKVFPSGRVQIN
jgi:hypothetical protein